MRNSWKTAFALLLGLSLGLTLVSCGNAESESNADAPASLTIRCMPNGEAFVDGESIGTTPIDGREVSAGKHEVVVRRDGFTDASKTVGADSGGVVALDMKLVATDPTDPAALLAMAELLELDPIETEQDETFRGSASKKAVVAIYPRGDVRTWDLDEFRVDVTENFEPNGQLEFRVGKKVLHQEKFDPESFVTVLPIPESVSSQVKPGQTVTWGYYPTKGKPVTSTFKIRKSDRQLEKRLARIEDRMAGQSDLLHDQMRAQLFLNKRLYYAAYRDARSVTRRAQSAPESLVIMQVALRRMKLKGTTLWTEIEGQVERLPSRFRTRFSR